MAERKKTEGHFICSRGEVEELEETARRADTKFKRSLPFGLFGIGMASHRMSASFLGRFPRIPLRKLVVFRELAGKASMISRREASRLTGRLRNRSSDLLHVSRPAVPACRFGRRRRRLPVFAPPGSLRMSPYHPPGLLGNLIWLCVMSS